MQRVSTSVRARCALALRPLNGAPGAIRTHGLPLRRGTLYPSELRGRGQHFRIAKRFMHPPEISLPGGHVDD